MCRYLPLAFAQLLILIYCQPVFSQSEGLAVVDSSATHLSTTDFDQALVHISGNGKMGTATLVIHDDMPVLLTADHVADAVGDTPTLSLRRNDGNVLRLDPSSNLRWEEHPKYDIAASVLNLGPGAKSGFSGRFIPSRFFSVEGVAPRRDVPLIMIGFPLSIGVQGTFSPLTLYCHSAAESLIRFKRIDTGEWLDFLALDRPTAQGISGGPVVELGMYQQLNMYTRDLRGTRIHGIVHGVAGDASGGKFGLVTPSHYVIEFLEAVYLEYNKSN